MGVSSIIRGNGIVRRLFRLNEVIEGWQIALLRMHPGSRWIVYIPYTMGYGTRTSGPIPAYSTLIFEVELLNIS